MGDEGLSVVGGERGEGRGGVLGGWISLGEL